MIPNFYKEYLEDSIQKNLEEAPRGIFFLAQVPYAVRPPRQ